MAAALQARGVGPGSHVALLGPTSRRLVTAIEATWLAGATLVVPPAADAARVDRGVRRSRRAGASRTRTPTSSSSTPSSRRSSPSNPATRRSSGSTSCGRAAGRSWERPDRRPRRARDPAVHERVDRRPEGRDAPAPVPVNNIDAIVEGAGLGADGPRRLVAAALPRHGSHRSADDADDHGLRSRARAARRTSSRRRRAGCSGCRTSAGRVTGGPNFSYVLAARAMRRLDGLDLSAWRWRSTARSRSTRLRSRRSRGGCRATGSTRRPPFCVYGMAEATLGDHVPRPRNRHDRRHRRHVALETERYAAPAPSHRHRRAPARPARPDAPRARAARRATPTPARRSATVRSASSRCAAPRSRRATTAPRGRRPRPSTTAGCAPATSATSSTASSWSAAGSRTSSSSAAATCSPKTSSAAAAAVEGVRAGNVIAFGTEGRRGKEGIVVVAETKATEPGPLRDAVVDRVCGAVGIPPLDVVLVRPGSCRRPRRASSSAPSARPSTTARPSRPCRCRFVPARAEANGSECGFRPPAGNTDGHRRPD